VVREIVFGAEARDASLGGVLAVSRFVQGQRGDIG
jgi:hypothetical protein